MNTCSELTETQKRSKLKRDKEMTNMSNEEMFAAIMGRLDKTDARLGAIESRLDKNDERFETLESKIDTLESNMNMEFQAVRTEMEFVNNSLKREIDMLNNKVDVLLFTKDVVGYDKINARLEVLEHGYQELREKIG